jgi:site-specific recombinase XerD
MTTLRKVPPSFASPLAGEMRSYIDLKRSLGGKYRTEEGTLADFDRFLTREAIAIPAAITQDLVRRWIATMTCGPMTLSHKMRLLYRFFEHIVGRGVMLSNPVRPSLPSRRPTTSFRPYIFRKEEVAAILENARTLRAYRLFPLRPTTVHMVLALLYGLGLRLGEARRLQVADVDLTRATLLIRQTKFHKSRLVPFGPRFAACLARYIDRRRTIFPPLASDDPLFVASARAPLSEQAVRGAFRMLLGKAGIRIIGRHRPRLHDLRHSFAVHRLLRWYREGVDVQAQISRLSTFMGHIDIQSTQVYLTVTPDLLEEANGRFYRRFGSFLQEAHS